MPSSPATSPAVSTPSPGSTTRRGSPARILVVDDEQSITDLLAMALRYEGMEVQVAHLGRQGLEAMTSFRPDLVVLDVMLPDLSGFDVLQRMSRDGIGGRMPVLFLTARDTLDDKLRGFTLGGDDYMTKPFSVEELIVRVRAILRRAHGSDDGGRLSVADLYLDEESHQVFRGSTPIELTPTEFKLLHYLLLNAGRVVSKSQILDRVWNYDFDGNANVVEIYISYLRKKIDSLGPPLIHTVRGVGYSLRRPPDQR
ncbi:MAG TPA: response regulator transcription factor [Acidimicrobiales bacterium]|nr:response regulator transcription factor [Acidimicrobiales bacterium]